MMSPADDITDVIVRWWSELLDEPTVDLDDDFFDLGGTSLTMMRLVARTQQQFGVDLPLAELFAEDLTPRTVARAITAALVPAGAGEESA